MAFWEAEIVPELRAGRRLLIASHGNTLRALLKALDGMSVAEVEDFEVPTAVPIVYAFSPKGEPVGWHYLGDDRRAATLAPSRVAALGTTRSAPDIRAAPRAAWLDLAERRALSG